MKNRKLKVAGAASSRFSGPASRSGFTIVELMVVIGIIAVLVGLLLPAVMRSRRSARNARALADLQTIGTALEAYKSDLGDYPPSTGANGITGAQLLAWAIVGPYRANAPVGPFNAMDGSDGPGFRANRGAGPDGVLGTADDLLRGSVYGPYVDAEKFLLPDPSATAATSYYIKDSFEQPVLYFRRLPNPLTNAAADLYNATQNDIVAAGNTLALNRPGATAQNRLNAMVTQDGATGPYLLWSAGADKAFGPDDPSASEQVKSCDDILLSGGH